MTAILKVNKVLHKPYFFPSLIALVLSTLFIGYAPSSIALGVLVFFSLLDAITSGRKINVQFVLLIPILIYVFFILSSLWTVNIDLTIKGLERTIPLCLIPICFLLLPKFTFFQTKLVLEYFTRANFLYGILFLSAAIINYFKTSSFSVFTYHELVSVLDLNAIYVSTYFLISLSYLLSKKEKSKLDKIGILLLISLILLLSSKMILLILILILVIHMVYFNNFSFFNNFKTILILFFGILIVGLTSTQVINRFLEEKTTNIDEVLYSEKFNRIYPWTGTSIRLLQARILCEQIEQESILWKGFGLFASRENLKKRHLEFNTYYGYHSYNYHNQYAQVLSELGVFGLMGILLLLCANFLKALKSKWLVVIAFAITIPLLFLTESFLWVHRGVIFFILLYCLFNRTVFSDL
ncbi:hypothetical protein A9Q86_03975 [Flavobacteriales bacterium 33_180_T64]|nr:hypothetical protein A9Q86_03975 [Flavobacteriales bacterium 33_180_T64]